MEAHKKLTIGLFGFGVVGEGLYKVLQQTPSLKAEIKKVCIKHPAKKDMHQMHFLQQIKNDLLFDDDINVIVEVIDDADAAFDIVTTALNNGKAVVSASKKMIAEHLPELLQLQKETTACHFCARLRHVPVFPSLEIWRSIMTMIFCIPLKAIINGSTNFILDQNV